MTTLSLRSKAGAFVARFYWRDAPTFFSLLPVPKLTRMDAPGLVEVIKYERRVLIAQDTWLYIEAGRKA